MTTRTDTIEELQMMNDALLDLRREMQRMEQELGSIGETLTLLKYSPAGSAPVQTPSQKNGGGVGYF